MKLFIFSFFGCFLISGMVHAQYSSVQTVAPTPQYQGYQDYQRNIQNNAPITIPSGNAIGIDRSIPTNPIRDLSGSNNFAQQNGVIIHNTGNRQRNQRFINHSLGRQPQLENRAR